MTTRFSYVPVVSHPIWLVLLLFLGFQALLGQTSPVVRKVVPPVWQGTNVTWVGDVQPRNKIDDAVDRGTNQMYDVVINFNRRPTLNDLTSLTNGTQKGRIQRTSQYVSSVLVSGLSYPEIVRVATNPGVAFIQQQAVYAPHLNISP